MRVFCAMVWVAVSCVAWGQESTEEQARRAIELAKAEAEALELFINSQELKREPEPLLRWTNPVSGQIYGDVYIWTLDGRPEAIASIYKWFSPHTHLATELQSLSESALTMTRYGSRAWSTGKGLEMKLLADAPHPGERAFQRSRQMHAIAEEFVAKAEDRSDATSTWNLRRLPKPIFRYQSEKRGIVDGAMFAFCQGNTNNPEVLLLLEARDTGGQLRWHYGLGRQNSLRFTVQRKNEVVWDVPKLAPPWPAVTDPSKPYLVIKSQTGS
ncbi:hypothetical protein [Stieleria mannarensis]|uniref:hypothetical protein n=1 Tax=Stieleria mannarensis TaxID=2755585 RepID=UPI0016017D2C|nr:hypothetical protein [Rhodopirellula sp. JC639]